MATEAKDLLAVGRAPVPVSIGQGKHADIRELLAARKDDMRGLIPGRLLTPEKLLRTAYLAVLGNKDLQSCSAESLIRCVIKAAELGFEIGGALNYLYMVPFKGEAVPIVSYQGLIYLMLLHPKVLDVRAKVVRSWDTYTYQEGTEPALTHIPQEPPDNADLNDAKTVKAVYAIVTLASKHGHTFQHAEWMWKGDVDTIRKRAPSQNSPAWRDYYPRMALKSVIRRLSTQVPKSTRLMDALRQDEEETPQSERELNAPPLVALPSGRAASMKSKLKAQAEEKVDAVTGEVEGPIEPPEDVVLPGQPGYEPGAEG